MPTRLVNIVGIALLVVCACTARAQDTAKPAGQEAGGAVTLAGGDSSFDPLQPIKPGFQLSISTSSNAGPEPSMSGVFTVDPSGNVVFTQLLGAVPVRGLTPSQAQDKVAALLKPYMVGPKVALSILSVPKPVVLLAGAVTRVGATQVNENTTLAELLTVAGFTEGGDLSKVRIVHRDEKGNRTLNEYNFLRWLKPLPTDKPDEDQNPVLHDKDLVYVPLKTLPGTGNVTVQGEVTKPGIVPLRVGVPVEMREVIALSGGPTPLADRRVVQIRRFGVDKPLVVDYDKMEAGDPMNNIQVMPDDIVYVQKLDVSSFVNLTGAFLRPGRLPYNKEVTLTQVIADSGGMAPGARDFEGRIFRHIGGSGDPTKTQVIAFNYRKIRLNQSPDLTIEPGDTVEVPIGAAPRPPLDALQIVQTTLSLFLSFSYLFGSRRY